MVTRAILWRRLDQSGHDAARLIQSEAGYELAGTAVFADDSRPCRLDYAVSCDVGWRTGAARVTGWVGNEPVAVAITVDPNGRWWLNERECPAVAGCVDVDLNFSPSTNLLPIRRLHLTIGQAVDVRAAWLHFPSFVLEPFEQVYRRLGAMTYRYEAEGGFSAELQVDDDGFVIQYADIWDATVAC